ncbi:hypothetical protein Ahy_B09g099183 [Arachis hypogaea]|uniref:Transposase MuDR plant domain-containing protein n=1 Tax=Arachis hypogaea TaxID=3818 RepID=A0A444XT71_ARAHY|nr:hypothetical protein Ahy_B09g099183 [Arachis hypogaea]
MIVTAKRSFYPTMAYWEERDYQHGSSGCNKHGVPFVQDSEFAIGMKFNSKEIVVMAIRNYTIFRGVEYRVFESDPLTFYAKCMQYGRDAIRPLVEADPSLKIRVVIADV